jgi:hypothetical protein
MGVINIGDGFKIDSDPGLRQWFKDATWKTNDDVDDIWVFLGISQGRGFHKFFHKLPINTGIEFMRTILAKMTLGGSELFTQVFSQQIADTLRSNEDVIKSRGLSIINEGVAQLGLESFTKDFHVKYFSDPNNDANFLSFYRRKTHHRQSDDFKKLMFFVRAMEWLHDHHFIIRKLDFNRNLQAKQTFTLINALHISMKELSDRPWHFNELPDNDLSWFARDKFSEFCAFYTSHDSIESKRKYSEIGRAMASIKRVNNEQEIDDQKQEIETNISDLGEGSVIDKVVAAGLGFLVLRG